MPYKRAKRRTMSWSRRGLVARSRVPLGTPLQRVRTRWLVEENGKIVEAYDTPHVSVLWMSDVLTGIKRQIKKGDLNEAIVSIDRNQEHLIAISDPHTAKRIKRFLE